MLLSCNSALPSQVVALVVGVMVVLTLSLSAYCAYKTRSKILRHGKANIYWVKPLFGQSQQQSAQALVCNGICFIACFVMTRCFRNVFVLCKWVRTSDLKKSCSLRLVLFLQPRTGWERTQLESWRPVYSCWQASSGFPVLLLTQKALWFILGTPRFHSDWSLTHAVNTAVYCLKKTMDDQQHYRIICEMKRFSFQAFDQVRAREFAVQSWSRIVSKDGFNQNIWYFNLFK